MDCYLLPGIVAFFLPCVIIIISFVVIWSVFKENKQRKATIQHGSQEGALNSIEIKFIRTVFIVCLCYVVVAGPLAFAKMFRELRTPSSMLVIISLMLCQYILNFFIYAYRCRQYEDAYWDVLILIFPWLLKVRTKWQKRRGVTFSLGKSNTTKETNESTKSS